MASFAQQKKKLPGENYLAPPTNQLKRMASRSLEDRVSQEPKTLQRKDSGLDIYQRAMSGDDIFKVPSTDRRPRVTTKRRKPVKSKLEKKSSFEQYLENEMGPLKPEEDDSIVDLAWLDKQLPEGFEGVFEWGTLEIGAGKGQPFDQEKKKYRTGIAPRRCCRHHDHNLASCFTGETLAPP